VLGLVWRFMGLLGFGLMFLQRSKRNILRKISLLYSKKSERKKTEGGA
jgi:hypothetical protein